ncbi:MAG: dihydrolipoyllysine-residue succinyltransferase [Pirellulales bacterium]
MQIGRWLKQPGDRVSRDENLVEIETDKASVDLPAPAAGVMGEILKRDGDVVGVGEIIAFLLDAPVAAPPATPSKPPAAAAPVAPPPPPTPIPTAPAPVAATPTVAVATAPRSPTGEPPTPPPAPPVPAPVAAPVPVAAPPAAPPPAPPPVSPPVLDVPPRAAVEKAATGLVAARSSGGTVAAEVTRSVSGELEEVVPMSLIRRRIAERLVSAQQTAALLTTFNEVDMSAVMQLRAEFKDAFQQQYGVKLGFMSFFVKAVVDGLKKCPELNAEIRGDREIVYRNYYDIGVAIGGGKGLVVPILRRAELMSFAQIEAAIADFGRRAQENKIAPEELVGGTFTISNGGVYGSLLSTPIVNPPQSGILGMHAIQERPVARNGQVVIRPMMYLALTYDHRIVDGREAVGFLKRVKDVIEEPSRMLMEI